MSQFSPWKDNNGIKAEEKLRSCVKSPWPSLTQWFSNVIILQNHLDEDDDDDDSNGGDDINNTVKYTFVLYNLIKHFSMFHVMQSGSH